MPRGQEVDRWQEDVTRGQEVARGPEGVARGQEVEEQMELEEQVEVVGAGTHRDGGDPRASATLWPPMPLPAGGEERLLEEEEVKEVEEEVEEVAAVKEQEASAMVPLLDRPFLEEAPAGKLAVEADIICIMYHLTCGQFNGFQGKNFIYPPLSPHLRLKKLPFQVWQASAASLKIRGVFVMRWAAVLR